MIWLLGGLFPSNHKFQMVKIQGMAVLGIMDQQKKGSDKANTPGTSHLQLPCALFLVAVLDLTCKY